MQDVNIEMTAKTPEVKLDQNSGKLELKGRSIPENSIEFYNPVFQWIDEYSLQPKSDTALHIQLEYFNTSSSKCVLDILKKLQSLNLSGRSKVKVLWYYEEDDEDMLEAGEDYQAIIKVPFEMIKISA
ncbi:MAG: DUF1987 domain-containing protein [Bacteroidetes bacterium]|nr:DUF1987 domain-containing protein [Bacteroidota bacterium]